MKKLFDLDITQEHINKALSDYDLYTNKINKCCPVYQALSEKINNKNISVGFNDVYRDDEEHKLLYKLSTNAINFTQILDPKNWKLIKPLTIEVFEGDE